MLGWGSGARVQILLGIGHELPWATSSHRKQAGGQDLIAFWDPVSGSELSQWAGQLKKGRAG